MSTLITDSMEEPSQSVALFPFFSHRNISCPEDQKEDRKVFSGYAPATSFLTLPTHENVREYLLDAEGRKRRRPTQVHRAMSDTLVTIPENFSILNGGIVIVARAVDIDEQKKVLRLHNSSIINGSQTQGILKDFYESNDPKNPNVHPVHVKYEIIVTTDDDLIGEISISRNYQNDVMTVSIAGRKGQLDELEESLRKKRPGKSLRKSETDLSDDFVATERLIQVMTALVPEELWPYKGDVGNPNKVHTYAMKTKCLKDFQKVHEKAHSKAEGDKISANDESERLKYENLYQFYLDIVAEADELYDKWKSHQGFQGTALRSLSRDGSSIVEVPDGIVYPILAALSAFAVKKNNIWTISPPPLFQDSELIRTAKTVYMEIAKSNPNQMGKNRACYSSLYQLTSLYKRLSPQEKSGSLQE